MDSGPARKIQSYRMCDVQVNGINVDFPFPPYAIQLAFMGKVTECLQKGENGLLESPTGTGKTLSLLCSALAWLSVKKAQIQSLSLISRENSSGFAKSVSNQLDAGGGAAAWGDASPGNSLPKIIYASRTHSQLTQVVQELKRSKYNYVKVAVLGSRDQMCIHPEVSKEPNSTFKLYMCMAKTSSRTCHFYNNVEAVATSPEFTTEAGVMDIEDLVAKGQKMKACPYYLSRDMKKNADIIFMPYNYLLDPKIRKMHGVEIENNVIIFDEAHNIEKICEESASINLRSVDIALAIDETNQVLKVFGKQGADDSESLDSNLTPTDFGPDELAILKGVLIDFERAVDAVEIPDRTKGVTKEGGFIRELLMCCRIQTSNFLTLLELVEKIVLYLSANSSSPFARKGAGLQKFADLIKVVFAKNQLHHLQKMNRAYRLHFGIEETKSRSNKSADGWLSKEGAVSAKTVKVLNYWCFSPGFGMEDLVELMPRCIILCSGTLSPLDSFAAELHVPFPQTLENPHIIQDNQVLVGVLQTGPDKVPLNSTYNNRNDPKYLTSLGKAIFYSAKVTPHGMLVFFPSYPVMKACIDHWQNDGNWTEIMRVKPIFVEPQTKDAFNALIKNYYSAIHDPVHEGAIFMAVCRGKVSEGLDFIDANGRTVIITGLPFPPLHDPRVILKKQYLEENRKSSLGKGLTGQDWYKLEAIRAVNQAVGRVIRHKNDYGAILFFDQRFGNPDNVSSLSVWVRKHVKKYTDAGKLVGDLRKFFKFAASEYPCAAKSDPSSKAVVKAEVKSQAPAALGYGGGLMSGNLVPSQRSASRSHLSLGYDAQLDVSQYATQAALKRDTEIPKGSLFESLNSASTKVLDFNSVKVEPIIKSSEKLSCQPTEKKRKLQLGTRYGSIPEVKSDTEHRASNMDFSYGTRDFGKSGVVGTLSSSGLSGKDLGGDSKQKNGSAGETSAISQNQKEVNAREYLIRVKGNLPDPEDYSRFKVLLKAYQSNKDVDELFRSLVDMFANVNKRLISVYFVKLSPGFGSDGKLAAKYQ